MIHRLSYHIFIIGKRQFYLSTDVMDTDQGILWLKLSRIRKWL